MNSTAHRALTVMNSVMQLEANASHQSHEDTTPTDFSGEDSFSSLTERVDLLEASVRDISLKQEDKITAQTEGQVVNMTISKGIEDIIGRVMSQELSASNDQMLRVSKHSEYLETRILQLENNFDGISNQMASLVKSVKNFTSSSSNAVEVTTKSPAEASDTIEDITAPSESEVTLTETSQMSEPPTSTSNPNPGLHVVDIDSAERSENANRTATPSLSELFGDSSDETF